MLKYVAINALRLGKASIGKCLEYLMPNRCLICSIIVQEEGNLCSTCWQSLNFIVPPFCNLCNKMLPAQMSWQVENLLCLQCMIAARHYDHGRALFKFDARSKQLIHALKYYDKSIIAQWAARMIYRRYKVEIDSYEIIIPVPMHQLKRLFRFYNQAQILAEQLAIISKKSVMSDNLLKIKFTASQTTLSRKQRLSNVHHSFVVSEPSLIAGRKVILVDDVMTTGSTMNHCAELLKKAGAKEIMALSLAVT